jgi:hypothetical protein
MTLFIKNYNMFMAKRRALKGNKGEKPRIRSKIVCYNCGKNGHFIAQCPHERREEDENNNKKKDKTYTKDKKDMAMVVMSSLSKSKLSLFESHSCPI